MSCLSPSNFPGANNASALALAIPGSSSSGGESPIENFLNDILSAVTIEDATICGNCDEGLAAFSKCLDCCEFLCDKCVVAHQFVRLTKHHRINRFITSAKTSPKSESASQMNSPCTGLTFCDNHGEQNRLFCQNCQALACTDCSLNDHRGHQLIYLEDAIEEAKAANVALNDETRSAVIAVREAIDSVQRMSESVEIRSLHVASDVRAVIRRYITALEERENDLLKCIQQTRQLKMKMLTNQMENLSLALSKLAHISDLLNESMESPNVVDLIAANERAAAELKVIRNIKSELSPCEDDTIIFIPPDTTFLRAISSMGCVTMSTPVPRLMRTRSHELPQPFVRSNEPGIFHPDLRSRPVFGCGMIAVKEANSQPILTFGFEGEGDGQLCRPWGVCCDHSGNIIVADRSNNRIQIFNSTGKFLFKFGSQGTGQGQFDRPAGVAVNPRGEIIVADKDNHRVQIFKNDGTFILTFGDKGSRNGQFNYPWDVACNAISQIVVSDTRNHRVQLFTAEGTYLCKYGFESSAQLWKHFDSPRGVTFTPGGNVIVTDFNNHRIVLLDHNLQHAQFMGQEGSSFKQFMRPQGITCDDEGRIIVADSRNNRLQVFDCMGNFLWKLGGVAGKGTGELDRPSGICLNPEGRIVVVDFGNNRVQVF